jgi:hypothetical protein
MFDQIRIAIIRKAGGKLAAESFSTKELCHEATAFFNLV